MSLEAVAKHLQTQGRGNDTQLVHMTPREVAGLQTLAMKHGGALTINPNTGLPEAGFLDSILPVVAGGVGAAFGLSPFMVAGGVGLATALATGDLGKGLSAGLGAYGGAGLGEALKTAGTTAVENAAVTGGDVATASLADQAATGVNAFTNPLAGGVAQSVGPNGLTGGANLFGATNAAPQISQQAANALTSQAPSAAKGAFTQQLTQQAMTPAQQLQQGFKNVTASPQAAFDFVRNNPGAVGGAVLPMFASSFEQEQYKAPPVDKGNIYEYGEFDQGYDPDGPRYFNQSYGTPTIRKLAYGGPVTYPQSSMPTDGGYSRATQIPVPTEVVGSQDANVGMFTGEPTYARGGITALAKGGRFMEGAGDGVSDDIPAVINGKQPAALADGEFVLPARIVSEIGNGSSKAGAKKLYAMMDRIQSNRRKTVGKDKVAVDSKAERYLPA